MRNDHSGWTAILLLLLTFGCASGTISDAGLTAVTGDTTYDSTDAMRFEIEQISSPMTFRGNSTADVCFRMMITNATKEPVRVKRISLQSMGGSVVRLETSSRKFDKTIVPGQKEEFRYWASATATDLAMNTSAPLVVRAAIDTVSEAGKLRAVFNRRVNGAFAVAVGSTP